MKLELIGSNGNSLPVVVVVVVVMV